MCPIHLLRSMLARPGQLEEQGGVANAQVSAALCCCCSTTQPAYCCVAVHCFANVIHKIFLLSNSLLAAGPIALALCMPYCFITAALNNNNSSISQQASSHPACACWWGQLSITYWSLGAGLHVGEPRSQWRPVPPPAVQCCEPSQPSCV